MASCNIMVMAVVVAVTTKEATEGNLMCPFRTGPQHKAGELGAMVEVQEATEVVTEDIARGQYPYRILRNDNLDLHMPKSKEPDILQYLSEIERNVTKILLAKNLHTSLWQSKIPIAGRLQYFVKNWQKITSDQFIIQIVQGYHLELDYPPFQKEIPPSPVFDKEQERTLDLEIQKLREKRAVEIVCPVQNQFISHMFVVPKKDGGSRPVINLKHLNNYVTYEHFKMEGLYMIRDLLKQGDWMCKIDMKDAYLTTSIHKDSRKYLRFIWKGKIYQFNCLPFGLASAPRIYTKLMKPVIGLLRKIGARLIIYLDDILLMAESKENLIQARDSTIYLLIHLGFIINWEKSKPMPSQKVEFLGFVIDSQQMIFNLSSEKVENIKLACRQILAEKSATVRQLAKLTGKLVSTLQAVIPANLQCRFLQMLQIKSLMLGKTYETKVDLTIEAQEELAWWINQIDQSNGRSVISPSPDIVITSDASNAGWGAVYLDKRTGGTWSFEEQELHINSKELLAAFFGLKVFTKSKENVLVHLRIDNTTAVAYINKMGGTKSGIMTKLVKNIWDWCKVKQITLSAEYLPGHLNTIADWESRNITDSSDWMLDKNIFEQILKVLGNCKIDLFASRLNCQLPDYISWRPDPEAVTTDAFMINWENMQGYAFPPFCVIGRCLAKIRIEKATIILIAPIWQAQPWYPMILQMLMADPVRLPCFPQILMSPSGQCHPLSLSGTLHLAAWKVSGNIQSQIAYQNKLQSYTCKHGDQEPELLTRVPGNDGLAGVIHNKLIQFKHLWKI